MRQPLVLAIDVGTSSVRASIYDAGLRPQRAIQVRYRWNVTPDGRAEGDPRTLSRHVARAVDGALEGERRPIDAVGLAAFWHSFMGVDDQGRPATPLLPWTDTRARAEALALRDRIDERAMHRRTGCRAHPSYWPARLLWFRRQDPGAFRRVTRWVSFTEWLEGQWLGRPCASISQASGTGLLDQDTCAWDPRMLAACGIDERRLSSLVDRDDAAALSKPLAARWPPLAHARWVPAVGDGAANNIGAGCVTKSRATLMIGTSGASRVLWKPRRGERVTAPFGLWRYRLDRERQLVGGALSNGGNVREWLLRMLAGRGDGPRRSRAAQDDLQRRADGLEPDSHGLTILPFFAGTRSPDYLVDARGTISGLTLATRREDLLRAGMESIAYRFSAMFQELRTAARIREIVAAGGGLERSAAWTGILADVLGRPIRLCSAAELTSRGTAALALASLGAIEIDALDPPRGRTVEPDRARARVYREAMKRQADLMDTLVSSG
jgi:gluconokinase